MLTQTLNASRMLQHVYSTPHALGCASRSVLCRRGKIQAIGTVSSGQERGNEASTALDSVTNALHGMPPPAPLRCFTTQSQQAIANHRACKTSCYVLESSIRLLRGGLLQAALLMVMLVLLWLLCLYSGYMAWKIRQEPHTEPRAS